MSQLDFIPQPMSESEMEHYRLHRRFDRMGRLVGDDIMKRLLKSHVMVVGLGGVGSFAAEMLVRSGIGKMTIIDFDEVCITNFNRQLHALQGTVGKAKAHILKERFQKINPKAEILEHVTFYNKDSAELILEKRPDYVIDAIDSVTSKAHLLAMCQEREIPVVSSGGAGGRMDPTQIHVADLNETTRDPLARSVRKILKNQFQFPAQKRFGIPTVFSSEEVTMPLDLAYDNGKGFRCVCPQGQNSPFNCDNRNLIHGNAGFVTGTFGFIAASVVVRHISGRFIWPKAGSNLPPIQQRDQFAKSDLFKDSAT